MSTGEIAALLMGIAAIITAISNARNGKDTSEKLRKQIEQSEKQNRELLEHNTFQDALLDDREHKIANLQQDMSQYQLQVDTLGRMINKQWLQIGHLQTLLGIQSGMTAPLTKNDDDG